MSVWDLPKSLEVNGKEYDIRSDFRAILDIINVFTDPNYEVDEKWIVCLTILYVDFDDLPSADYEEAMKKASWFIDCGNEEEKDTKKPPLMDWVQDAPVIIPSINRVLGYECRAKEYVHWWTFVGAYMEIGESLFSQVISIRSKQQKGKPLDKYEKEFLVENKDLVILKNRLTDEEKDLHDEEQRALRELLGG